MTRILLVEDDVFIALDLAELLSAAGYDMVGPATSVAAATSLLDDCGCDAAVIDVHLGDETSAAIAQRLRRDAIPFVVLSGYAQENLSADFAGARLVSKPVRMSELLRALEEASAAGG
jgi:DNA-binding response OmpR family regulator